MKELSGPTWKLLLRELLLSCHCRTNNSTISKGFKSDFGITIFMVFSIVCKTVFKRKGSVVSTGFKLSVCTDQLCDFGMKLPELEFPTCKMGIVMLSS